MTARTPIATVPDFDALVERLATLSRNHLLFFKVEVGRALDEGFFSGDANAYRSQDPFKDTSLRQFATERADELRELGLNEQALRKCLHAWYVVRDLPPELVARLVISHVVELARLHDEPTRRLLAQATVDNAWTSRALRDAVLAVRAGRWIDGDPAKGLQPPAPQIEEARRPQPGRVVTRFEKTVEDLGELGGQWATVEVEKLTALQATRVRAALAAHKAWIAEVEGRL